MKGPWHFISQEFVALSPARRRILLVAGSLVVLCLLTVLTSQHGMSKRILIPPQALATHEFENYAKSQTDTSSSFINNDAAMKSLNAAEALSRGQYLSATGAEPRIAYSAELAVITKNFVHARSSMEDILEKHRGYAAKLRMVGQPSGSTLSATLKVPASEYPSALADLKSIGNVEQDEEAADEIVQQRGDIEARLQNAQNNERRLQLLLKDHDGKIIDLASIERQLATLHGDIVQMELQRHSFDNRVVFSNIHFSLREERDAPVETISAQLRSAAGSGLADAIHGLSALLLVLVSYGPSFVLWAAVLFFPARYLWRHSRVPLVRESA
ncbi:MAG TPA: DUF4349 domain-containing protein [Candidatus Dormibacteraeota bacterium]|jgi:hypothetical protein|nr:DUF4349 domain-containing protein [Candidatus Dormibacteraeota bacterium]